MNIFAAISSILTAIVSIITGTANAITNQGVPTIENTLKSFNNMSLMAEHMTSSMLEEQREEAAQALDKLKASAPKAKATK